MDWITYLVAIGVLALIGYIVFYPMFEEWVHRFWEEWDRIKDKLKGKVEEKESW